MALKIVVDMSTNASMRGGEPKVHGHCGLPWFRI